MERRRGGKREDARRALVGVDEDEEDDRIDTVGTRESFLES